MRAKISRLMMELPTPQLQGGGTTQLKNRASIPPPEELELIEDDKDVAYFKSERSNPN